MAQLARVAAADAMGPLGGAYGSRLSFQSRHHCTLRFFDGAGVYALLQFVMGAASVGGLFHFHVRQWKSHLDASLRVTDGFVIFGLRTAIGRFPVQAHQSEGMKLAVSTSHRNFRYCPYLTPSVLN